ncbi:MAG: ABC transporter ATP-binding protein [Bacteroidales bacterium]|nr:ABC transporter ATP-binding protein [Bacteroidales bacterium]
MIIETRNIRKSFGTLPVLNGIDLDVASGEIVSIVGKSGAGKTTLLQIMGTLLNADEGTLSILGTDVGKLKEKELATFRNEHIGFVFQFHQLLPEFTALENVCLPAMIQGKSGKQCEARAKELLDFLNLSERMTHKPAEMSGGEQQRVAVARAIMNNPAVVFADEPSGNLDSHNKKELHELLLRLRDTFNQTFVIVTHDDNLAAISDRVIKMEDGKIIEDGR